MATDNKTPAERYQAAYNLHYKEKDYKAAYDFYLLIVNEHSTSPEANYAKTQINNILSLGILDAPSCEAPQASAASLDAYFDSMFHEKWNDVMVTSGFNFDGYTIEKYVDFISYETAIGIGYFKSLAASISNILGEVSDELNEKLSNAKSSSMKGIRLLALEKGCNAIIGFDIDYTMFYDTMVAVITSGTCVMIRKKED